jgi:hypothetical protein
MAEICKNLLNCLSKVLPCFNVLANLLFSSKVKNWRRWLKNLTCPPSPQKKAFWGDNGTFTYETPFNFKSDVIIFMKKILFVEVTTQKEKYEKLCRTYIRKLDWIQKNKSYSIIINKR